MRWSDARVVMHVLRFAAVWLVGAALISGSARGADGPPLPGTEQLTGPEDLSGLMMDGLHRFVERKIAEAPAGRAAFWKRDISSPEAYARSIEANRVRMRQDLGVD